MQRRGSAAVECVDAVDAACHQQVYEGYADDAREYRGKRLVLYAGQGVVGDDGVGRGLGALHEAGVFGDALQAVGGAGREGRKQYDRYG